MIDLKYTKEQMLTDLGTPEDLQVFSSFAGLTSPEFLTGANARVIIKAKEREEILLPLNAALSARFADVALKILELDLLAPLKKAVGNAYKRGNQMNPDKWITVEVVVTKKGACIEVSDEGAGFDVCEIMAQRGSGENCHSYSGSGFRRFAKTDSVISFANGGRTFLACFMAMQG